MSFPSFLTFVAASVAGVSLLALAGCSHSVFSPPARPMPLESAATLPPGDTGVQIEGATHSATFGPSALSGTVRVRHGLAENLDVAVEASVLRIHGSANPASPVSPLVHSGRAGLKYRLAKSLSVAAGLGGGYSAGGAFLSPDAGPILAWENRYFVPFVAARAGISQPIGAREIDTSEAGTAPRTYVDTPRTTWLVSVTPGFRVPIGWADPEAGFRGSLLAGVGLSHLADARDDETFLQLAAGGEIVW